MYEMQNTFVELVIALCQEYKIVVRDTCIMFVGKKKLQSPL